MAPGSNEKLGISIEIDKVTTAQGLGKAIEEAVQSEATKAKPEVKLAGFDTTKMSKDFTDLFAKFKLGIESLNASLGNVGKGGGVTAHLNKDLDETAKKFRSLREELSKGAELRISTNRAEIARAQQELQKLKEFKVAYQSKLADQGGGMNTYTVNASNEAAARKLVNAQMAEARAVGNDYSRAFTLEEIKKSTATLQDRIAAFKALGTGVVNTGPTPITAIASQVSADAVKLKDVTSRTLDEVKAGFTSAANTTWNEFLKANKAAALEYTQDWHKAQKLLSESFRSGSGGAGGRGPTPTVERNPDDAYLAKAIANEQDKAKVRAVIAREGEKLDQLEALKNTRIRIADERRMQNEARSDEEKRDSSWRLYKLQEERKVQQQTLAMLRERIQQEKEIEKQKVADLATMHAKVQAQSRAEANPEKVVKGTDLTTFAREQQAKILEASSAAALKNAEELRRIQVEDARQTANIAARKLNDAEQLLKLERQLSTLRIENAKFTAKGGSGIDTSRITSLEAGVAGGGDWKTLRSTFEGLRTELRNLKLEAGTLSASDPFKNMFKGLPVATTSIHELTGRLKALHGDLTALDGASLSKINSQLRQYKAELDLSNGSVKEMSAQTSFLGISLGRMATRLAEFYSMRTVLFAVGSQFRQATTAALEHSQAIHDIIAISGDAKTELGSVSDAIYAIAKSSRYSTKEVAELMQVLAQAGVAGKDLSGTSMAVGMFATATAADPKIAADLATTAMNNYGIKATEISRVTNAMTAALNLSKLEASGLATAFNYLAPQSAQLGMSMEKTLAIIANMAQAGIKSSTIGTGVSQLLKELAAPKPRLRKMLEVYGIDEASVNPMKNDFADIVQTMQNAKVSVSDLFAALESRVGRAAVTAINLSAQSFREMEVNLTGTHAALIAYDKTMEGAKARLNVTKQAFNELATTIGNHLAPALIVGSDAVRDIIGTMSGSHGTIVKWAVDIGLATAAVGTLALAIKTISLTAIGGAIGGAVASIAAGLGNIVFFVQAAASSAVSLGTAFSLAFGVAFSTIALPIAAIAILTAGIGALVWQLGAKRRAEEASNKATLEAVDANEKLGRTYQSIINGTDQTSKAYADYLKLVREHKEGSKEAVALRSTEIELTKDHKKYLNELVSKGGPMAEHAQRLLTQKVLLGDIIALENQRRNDANMLTQSQVLEHNRKMKELREETNLKTLKENIPWWMSVSKGQEGVVDKQIRTGAYGEEKKNNYLKQMEENKKLFSSQGAEMAAKKGLVGKENMGETGANLLVALDADGNALYTPVEQKSPKDTKRIAGGKTSGGAASTRSKPTPVDYARAIDEVTETFDKEVASAVVQQAKDRLAEAKDMLTGTTTMADYEFAFKDYTDALDQVALDTLSAAETKARETIAGKIKATYNATSKEYEWHGETAGADASNYMLNKAAFDAQEKRMMAEAQRAAESTRTKAIATAPEHKEEKLAKDNTTRLEKDENMRLAKRMSLLQVERDLVWTADARYQKEVEILATEEDSSERVKKIYEDRKADLELQREKKQNDQDWIAAMEQVDGQLKDIELKHEGILIKMREAKKLVGEGALLNSFTTGARSAWVKQTDFQGQSEQLGGSMVNTAVNGTTQALSNSFDAAFNPDKAKIAELKGSIATLRTEKTQIEGEIKAIEMNSSKTPQELKDLADKKVKLDGINRSLESQQQAVRKQTDAWQAFADGLKSTMKEILKELQAYLMKLIVVGIVKKAVGLAVGAFSGGEKTDIGTGSQLGGSDFSSSLKVDPQFKTFSKGGLVPTLPGSTPGKDSIKALIAPEEFIIPADIVKSWGSDHFEKYRTGEFKKFAEGGLGSGKAVAPGQAPAGGKQEFTLQIVNVTPEQRPPNPGENSQQIINVINADIQRRGATFRTIKASL